MTHRLGMECNFQLQHFGRQIQDLLGDLRRGIKWQHDTNRMFDYQIGQLNDQAQQIARGAREITYDVLSIETTARARHKSCSPF